MLEVSCVLQEFEFPPKFLGFLAIQLWDAVVNSRKWLQIRRKTWCVVWLIFIIYYYVKVKKVKLSP
jgi:hypothetical protein